MENSLNEYNQSLVYPDHCLPPVEIQHRLKSFKDDLKEFTDKYENSQTPKNKSIMLDNIIDSMETHILPANIKITSKLTKSGINDLIQKLDSSLDDKDFMWNLHLLNQAGFILSSIFPVSFQPEALIIPEKFLKEKNEIVKKYNNSKKESDDAITFQNEISKVANDVKQYFEDNDITVVDMMNSGAKGDSSHIRALLLSVGLSIDSFGKINDVIDRSHTEGLTQTQFFNGSSQAIQALYAKSSETAKPGYLGRKLSTIGQNIQLSASKDCGTTRTLKIKIKDSKVMESLIGRHYKKQSLLKNYALITKETDLIGKTIELRSPLYCKAKDGICEMCYNEDYIRLMGLKHQDNIGLLASTGLTEVLISLTLKKSHVGITLDKDGVDLVKDIKDMF